MMGSIGMGNNPMVGDIDAVAVNCASACSIYATCDIVLQRKRVSAATST